MIKTISFIGSGNVATQFALAFKSVGFQINYIHSRNKVTGEQLAKKVKATFIESISNLKKCDLIMICIHDDNIKDVIHLLPNTLIIHTSGSTSLEVFTKKKNYGVIYPLQSLSKNTHVDFTHVPICIEANNKSTEDKLIDLCSKISKKTNILNSHNRKILHLAAVISCNFSNFCYLMAHNILQENNIDVNLLKPLISYTAEKNTEKEPYSNQTGPARRGDSNTIKSHLSMLKNEKYKKIYKLLS